MQPHSKSPRFHEDFGGLRNRRSTSDAVVGPIDIYPTLLELIGIDKPAEQIFDGVSYANVLTGKGSQKREAYFNYHPHAGTNRAGGIWVRSGDFKLIRWTGASDERRVV